MATVSHDHDAACTCAADHRPPPLELHSHHVWPLYLGGPDTTENRRWLCPTTHANVHEILRALCRDGLLTFTEYGYVTDRPVSRFAYRLAVEGYLAWRDAGIRV